jgi:hypothetical protein
MSRPTRYAQLIVLIILAMLNKGEGCQGASASDCAPGCRGDSTGTPDPGIPTLLGPREPVAVGAEMSCKVDYGSTVERVTAATVENGGIFQVLSFGQGAVIRVRALAEGETLLAGTCVAGGKDWTSQVSLKALKANRIAASPECWWQKAKTALAAKTLAVPTSAQLDLGIELFKDTTLLSAESYLPVETGSLERVTSRSETSSLQELVVRAPATPGKTRIWSVLDGLDLPVVIYDSIDGVALAPRSAGPYRTGAVSSLSVVVHLLVGGDDACVEPSDRWTKVLTNETPSLCSMRRNDLGNEVTEVRDINPVQVRLTGKDEGTCRLSVKVEGTSLSASASYVFTHALVPAGDASSVRDGGAGDGGGHDSTVDQTTTH